MPCRYAKSAGQDAPPTEKENEIINPLYSLLSKRNDITRMRRSPRVTLSQGTG